MDLTKYGSSPYAAGVPEKAPRSQPFAPVTGGHRRVYIAAV